MTEKNTPIPDGAFKRLWKFDVVRILLPRAHKIRESLVEPPPGSPRICVDCKHHATHPLNPKNSKLDVCNAPKNVELNLVRGNVKYVIPSCEGLRSFGVDKFCGPQARWFEPKSTNPPADVGGTQEA